MLKPENRTVLSRNKQVALCVLLTTRSAFRGRLEGVPTNAGELPDPPKTPEDLINRAKDNLPDYIEAADIDKVFLDELFVPPAPVGSAPSPGQINNVSTDIATIMTALDIDYDPSRPDCPNPRETNLVSAAIVKALPESEG